MSRYSWARIGDGTHKVTLEHNDLSLLVCTTSSDDNARHIAHCLEATEEHQVAGLDAIKLVFDMLESWSVIDAPHPIVHSWQERATAIKAKIEHHSGSHEIAALALAACRAMREAHQELFCTGRPLSIDGTPINHTKLNMAADLAQVALRKNGERT